MFGMQMWPLPSLPQIYSSVLTILRHVPLIFPFIEASIFVNSGHTRLPTSIPWSLLQAMTEFDQIACGL